jgi:hypothetical protein
MDSMGAGAARCSTRDPTTPARDLVEAVLAWYAVGIGLQARDQAQTSGTLAPSGLGQAMQVHLLPVHADYASLYKPVDQWIRCVISPLAACRLMAV